LEYPTKSFDTFVVAVAGTVMTQPNGERMAKYFPGLPFKR
jgi:hypothetical protein